MQAFFIFYNFSFEGTDLIAFPNREHLAPRRRVPAFIYA